jgi:transposase
MVQERTSEIQRVEKTLEKAGIKLASVASKTLGVSGRAMLDALIAGETDPERLADLARGRLRAKLPELRLALASRFTDHHRWLLAHHLARIDDLNQRIAALDTIIEGSCVPYQDTIDRLRTIPGVGTNIAQVLVAEIGVDMTCFPTAAHLASWAGVAPGNNESAGKHRPAATGHSNPWLADALCQAAWAAARTKDTFLSAKFRRLAGRIGAKKAVIAIAHTIVLSIWHMHTNTENYHDLGSDHRPPQHANPDREIQRLLGRLQTLGYTATNSIDN